MSAMCTRWITEKPISSQNTLSLQTEIVATTHYCNAGVIAQSFQHDPNLALRRVLLAYVSAKIVDGFLDSFFLNHVVLLCRYNNFWPKK